MRRTLFDRLRGLFRNSLPKHRYRCRSMQCEWEGCLPAGLGDSGLYGRQGPRAHLLEPSQMGPLGE